jgi:replicative DNA helicase
MKQAARYLADRGLPVTLDTVGAVLRERDPFYIVDAERALLSSLISGGGIPAELTPDMFLVPRHRLVFDALRSLADLRLLTRRGENLPLLENILQGAGLLEAAGGLEFLRSLGGVCGIPAAAPGLAAAVAESYTRRENNAASPTN